MSPQNLDVMNRKKRVTGPRTQYTGSHTKVHPDPQNHGTMTNRVSIGPKDFEDGDSDDDMVLPTISGTERNVNVSKRPVPMVHIPRQLSGSVPPRLLMRNKPDWKMVPRRLGKKRTSSEKSKLKFRRALLKIAHRRARKNKPKNSLKKVIFGIFGRSNSVSEHPRRLSQATKPQSIRNLMQLMENHQAKINNLVRTAESPVLWRRISQGSAQNILDKKNIVTEEETELLESQTCCLIAHHSSFVAVWDCFMALFIITVIALWTPIQLAFCFPDAQHEPEQPMDGCPHFHTDLGLCVLIQLVLIVDLVLNFNTTAVNLKGEEVTSRKEIVMNYVCTETRRCFSADFLCDIISAIPIVLIFAAAGYQNWVRLLRLLVLLKVYKLRTLVVYLEDHFQLNIVYSEFINLAMWFCIISHIFSCLFYLSADVRNSNNQDPHNSWIYHAGMYANSALLGDKYIITLYWFSATLFTVGYGDVVAHSTTERMFAVLAMIAGCVVYSFIIGTVTQLLMRVGTHEELFHTKMKEIDAFLQAREVPLALQVRIRMYFHHYYRKKSAFDEREILKNLSVFLRRELGLHLLHSSIFKIPVFQILVQDMDMELVAGLLNILRPFQCTPGSMLFTTGETGDKVMFVLTKGKMDELYEAHQGDLHLRVMDGMCVGEMYAFGVTVERITTVVSRTSAELFELNVKELRKCLFEKPELFVKMKTEAMEKLQQLRSMHGKIGGESKVQPDWKMSLSTRALETVDESLEHEATLHSVETPRNSRGQPSAQMHASSQKFPDPVAVDAQADAILAAMKPKLEAMVRDVVKDALRDLTPNVVGSLHEDPLETDPLS